MGVELVVTASILVLFIYFLKNISNESKQKGKIDAKLRIIVLEEKEKELNDLIEEVNKKELNKDKAEEVSKQIMELNYFSLQTLSEKDKIYISEKVEELKEKIKKEI